MVLVEAIYVVLPERNSQYFYYYPNQTSRANKENVFIYLSTITTTTYFLIMFLLFSHKINVHVPLSVRCQNRKLAKHWTTCAAFVLLRHESVTRLCVHRAESHCPQVPGCETVENTKVYFPSSLRVKSMGSGRPERIQRIYPAQSRWHDKLGQYRFVNAQLRCLIRVIM